MRGRLHRPEVAGIADSIRLLAGDPDSVVNLDEVRLKDSGKRLIEPELSRNGCDPTQLSGTHRQARLVHIARHRWYISLGAGGTVRPAQAGTV